MYLKIFIFAIFLININGDNTFIQKIKKSEIIRESQIKTRSLPDEINSLEENNNNFNLSDNIYLIKIKNAIKNIRGPECVRDLNYTINNFENGKPWAIASEFKI